MSSMLGSSRIDKTRLIDPDQALPGRDTPMAGLPEVHFVLGSALTREPESSEETVVVGMGCFWGAERKFWSLPGVAVTAVGYAGGHTPNPTYREVCSGRTGHTEVVRVIYDPTIVSFEALLAVFWENHDPTQGMRQGNDVGTQYRSAIFTTTSAQLESARASRDRYERALTEAGRNPITTEIAAAGPFYFAEADHQQYLAHNPNGYCGLGGTGVACPAPTA